MNKLLYILFLLVGFYKTTLAQIGNPAGLPNPSSVGYMKYGYVREDSGFITMPRDTFCAKYPTIIKHNNGKYYRTEGNCTRWFELYWDAWSLTGNAGTTAGTNFIGTTDGIDWVIKTNNTERARFLVNGNLGIGTTTPTKLLVVAGSDALINTLTIGRGTGNVSTNTAVGISALLTNTNGNNNTAIGTLALRFNTTGFNNTAIGKSALELNDIGTNNTGFGAGALFMNSSGTRNGAFGSECMANTTIGSYNIGFGFGSLFMNSVGSRNIAIGDSALYNSIADSNIAIGDKGGAGIQSGSNNIHIGNGGSGVTTGSNTVMIGAFPTPVSSSLTNHVEIHDGSGNLAFSKDANGLSRINVQALQTVNVSSAGTLALNNNFSDYVFAGTTTTWTLPSISGFTNVKYFIKNRGSGDITLNSNAGGNDIYITSAVNTYTIAAGEAAIFMCDGTYWNRMNN